MIRIPSITCVVGSTEADRQRIAAEFGLHPSFLEDELVARRVSVGEFLVDEFPVTRFRHDLNSGDLDV
jgi:hypothetical protein